MLLHIMKVYMKERRLVMVARVHQDYKTRMTKKDDNCHIILAMIFFIIMRYLVNYHVNYIYMRYILSFPYFILILYFL